MVVRCISSPESLTGVDLPTAVLIYSACEHDSQLAQERQHAEVKISAS